MNWNEEKNTCHSFFTPQAKPIEVARRWTISRAWDKGLKDYKYNKFCILSAEIKVSKDQFLDLTTPDGMELFNYLREKYIKKIKESKKYIKEIDFKDGQFINDARNNIKINIDVVLGHYYIGFSVENFYNIRFRTPK